ncbi:retroviral-like aspartic protease family protein [Azospirillum sp. B4]|uniref:retroviral-like aspartic protease family protein n=1 Tax=Azospirillum sp. B4 TaxID=95605 RepID=UPI00034A7AB5|nr:retroviral-like aspartic protease family protein [Azospirillum sp. B4]
MLLAWTVVLASATAQAAPACKLAQVATIPLELNGNQLLASATINGKPAHLLVDTGAWMSILNRSSLDYLGLHAVDAGSELIGIDGSSRLLQTTMDTLELGAWQSRDVRVYVGGYGKWDGDIVGFLGMDLLERYDLEFDVAHNVLNLFKPENCDGKVLAYWSDSYNLVEMETMRGARSRIRLAVTVNGQPVHAELDSGAAITLMDETVARRLGVDVNSDAVQKADPLQGANGFRIDSHIGVFDSLAIGDETIRHARLRLTDLYGRVGEAYVGSRLATSQGDTDMYIGADFLRSHRVYIASSQRRIYFTYQGGPVFQVVGPAMVWNGDGSTAAASSAPAARPPVVETPRPKE